MKDPFLMCKMLVFCILSAGPAQAHVAPVVAAPGSDITLSCFFAPSKTEDPLNVLVTWWHEDRVVVHRYDHGRDQLQEQSSAYRGRTQLDPEQIAVGNPSLRLTGVQAMDHGSYTCAVDSEGINFSTQVSLLVAAPYDEPNLAILTTCENITVRLTAGMGYPEPTISWAGGNGTKVTQLSLDSRGRYKVLSEMVLRPTSPHHIKVEMKQEALNRRFSQAITLYPLPNCRTGTPSPGTGTPSPRQLKTSQSRP